MAVTLAEACAHVRQDVGPEDDAIQSMIDAATAAAWDYLGVDLSDAMPAPVHAAILLQVGDLYGNREAGGDQQYFVNPTYARLLDPYRTMEI